MTHLLDPAVAGQVGAWLATYAAHGVALFAAAWLGARVVGNMRVREQLWRAALFGPLVTASLQLGAGISPIGGNWNIELDSAAARPIAVAPFDGPVGSMPDARTVMVLLADSSVSPTDAQVLAMTTLPDGLGQIIGEPTGPVGNLRRTWTILATGFLAAGIAALMVRALFEALRVQRLGRGVVLTRGPMVHFADAIAKRTGVRRRVRIEVTEHGTSPYATGVLWPRIVVPERAMAELDDAAIRAMLAHEMGHVARLDPLWTTAIRSVSSLFFFQPLNWIIAQRLDECAEFCCDEFAVDATGDEIALARCLASVADWIVGPQNARPACAMAHQRSPLGRRVERILATDGEVQRRHVGARFVSPAVIGLTALAVPGFAITLQPDTSLDAGSWSTYFTPEYEVGFPDPGTDLAQFDVIDFPVVRGTVRANAIVPNRRVLLVRSLDSSLDLLDAELAEIRQLADERSVSPETIQQLQSMLEKAARIRSLTRLVDQLAATDAPGTSRR